MSAGHLLDASAVLAVILEEPGTDRVMEAIDNSRIHPINLTEVAKKLGIEGIPPAEVEAILEAMELAVDGDWNRRKACRAGELLVANKAVGLSLGDAVCLIEASERALIAVTAERRWPEVVWPDWPSEEQLPRPEILLIR